MKLPIILGKDFKVDEPIEIFGMSFFLDDILIFGVIFLLYKEGVKDYLLYIVLFLLTDFGEKIINLKSA